MKVIYIKKKKKFNELFISIKGWKNIYIKIK